MFWFRERGDAHLEGGTHQPPFVAAAANGAAAAVPERPVTPSLFCSFVRCTILNIDVVHVSARRAPRHTHHPSSSSGGSGRRRRVLAHGRAVGSIKQSGGQISQGGAFSTRARATAKQTRTNKQLILLFVFAPPRSFYQQNHESLTLYGGGGAGGALSTRPSASTQPCRIDFSILTSRAATFWRGVDAGSAKISKSAAIEGRR